MAFSPTNVVCIEWPTKCAYWELECVQEFLQKHRLVMHNIHGCAYGLVGQNDHKGKPILKPWTIATTCPTDLSSRCPGKNVHPYHAPCEANETKLTEDYTWLLVNAIHKAHSHHVSKNVPGHDERPPCCVENIKGQGQGQDKDKRKVPAMTSGYSEEDTVTVLNFNEKTCLNVCPTGPSPKGGEVIVHVGPASRSNVKVDSFDCPSISALTLLDASAHTLEAARQSCAELERDMMEQKKGLDYYAVLHDARKTWESIVELKPAKIQSLIHI